MGLKETRVADVGFDADGLVVDVAPTWRRSRRSECGEIRPGYDRQRDRRWRYLDVAGMQLLSLRIGRTVTHKPTGRRDLSMLDLPEERIEITDPALEGKARRLGFEESRELRWRRGGFRRGHW